ncbi:hypothetical protein ABE099_11755 [Paenibacillus turicensis]|uniref:hypothetical protein n=1 Tax=Paenibacillus turicensis TaxID=160487 RepID=UPI003D2CAD69
MSLSRKSVEQDFIIEKVQSVFQCRVLWSEGRPCLEYDSLEELDKIEAYVEAEFGEKLLDVFFTAVESLPNY